MTKIDYKARYLENIRTKESRISKLYWIMNDAGKVVKFRPNWAQQELSQVTHPKQIIVKARQLGMSTAIQIDILDDALTIPNLQCGVICQDLPSAQDVFENKIKFAYDNLDPITRSVVTVDTNNVREMKFSNGSSITVGTSMRSKTLQRLHVSEFAKLAKENPQRAREVITGALNTVNVQKGGKIWIESTAEGREGEFYDMVTQAEKLQASGAKLSPLDWQLIFFPWHKHPAYELDFELPITTEQEAYFAEVEGNCNTKLTDEKKYWYVAKEREQKTDMKREYPSFIEEAFGETSEGLYFHKWMMHIRKEGRIGSFPPIPNIPVESVWDLGWNDMTAIFLFQRIGQNVRIIHYLQDRLQDLTYYVNKLHDLRAELRITYGDHWLPHDVEVTSLNDGITRKQKLQSLGMDVRVLEPMPPREGIQASRDLILRSYFDEKRCALGIEALEKHRMVWDTKQGMYIDREYKDMKTIHGCHAFKYLALAMSKSGGDDTDELKLIRRMNNRSI